MRPPPLKKSSLWATCITYLTSQEHDLNTGLIYFGARYYDPDTARFITQDTYLGMPGTPPSLHRYLYAYSNPTVFIDLEGYESVTTMLDKSAMKAADEGKNLKLAGIVALQAGYKLADFITFGFIGKHDEARDAYDRGEISGSEYLGRAGKAAATSAALATATAVTGGVAGAVVKGASLTTRLVVAGAASGVGYQAADDAIRGQLSSGSAYLKAAGMGALGGVAARGAIGLKSMVGNASVGEGMQILKASAAQKIRQLPKMTQEFASSFSNASQNLMTQGKNLISSSRLASEVGSVGTGTRRLYLNEKFRGRANVDLNQTINEGGGYVRGLKTSSGNWSPDSGFYEVGFEAKLTKEIHYPGVSDARHFQEGNKQLYELFQSQPKLALEMENLYPGIMKGVQPGTLGAFPRRAPTRNLTWHHEANREGILQLVLKQQHKSSGYVQQIFHPEGKGGMVIWGGGR